MFANILRDTRYAIRQLRAGRRASRSWPILTLALGIGASSAIFSVVNGVLLRPLAYPNPDRIVRVHEILQKFGRFSVAPATFLDWRQQNTVFAQHRRHEFDRGDARRRSTGAERIAGGLVSWDMFDLLQVTPALGRTFRAEEDAPGKDAVIILSHGMWQRRFGGDPGILGQSVTLSGTPVTVIGVMPAGLAFMAEAEFWRPLALPANPTRGGHFLGVIARLKPGVTVRAGRRRDQDDFRAAGRAVSGRQRERVGRSHRPAGQHRRGDPAGAADAALAAVGRGHPDRLRQRRQSAAGARLGPREGDRDPNRARRRPAAADPSDALREPRPRPGRRRGRAPAGVSGHRPDPDAERGQHPEGRPTSRSTARCCSSRSVVSLATGILFGLAPAWQASRSTIGSVLKEGGRSSTSSSGRWVRNAPARRRSRDVDRAARRRGAAPAQLRAADERRSRLPARARPRVPRRAAERRLSRAISNASPSSTRCSRGSRRFPRSPRQG